MFNRSGVAGQLWAAVVVLLLAALGARAVWLILQPLVPVLIVLVCLVGLLRLLVRRRGW